MLQSQMALVTAFQHRFHQLPLGPAAILKSTSNWEKHL